MQLTEKLLHYIWVHRYYNSSELRTSEGLSIQIIHPGTWNKDAGPDFLNARIKIDRTTLAGHIELHLKSSDWIKHGHSGDIHYKNLILHVVHENDVQEHEELPKNVAVLEMKGRISGLLLEKYERLMHQEGTILCADQLDKINSLTWLSWKDRLMVERWQMKTALFAEWMNENKNDWSETFYLALARNFGLPVNGEAFLSVARSLPLHIVGHYKDKLLAMEALFFGQAGFLDQTYADTYPQHLKEQYLFLKKKHQLTPVPKHLWKWARMRPPSFPTFRLAQFAALMASYSHLFSKLLEIKDLKKVKELFKIKAASYWETHYRFGKESPKHATHLGSGIINRILINTVCPILAMYDQFQLDGTFLDRAFGWMKELPPEHNKYTRKWEKLGIPNQNAWDSQSLLQLIKYYCTEKRCLECAIGYQLLRN